MAGDGPSVYLCLVLRIKVLRMCPWSRTVSVWWN